jgi:hypothetical protein
VGRPNDNNLHKTRNTVSFASGARAACVVCAHARVLCMYACARACLYVSVYTRAVDATCACVPVRVRTRACLE